MAGSQNGENAALAGLWLHSHEEDTPGETVYRPEGFQFPPSRGRGSLLIAADGAVTQQSVGPTDRPSTGSTVLGKLQRSNDNSLELALPAQETLQLDQRAPDKLILMKK